MVRRCLFPTQLLTRTHPPEKDAVLFQALTRHSPSTFPLSLARWWGSQTCSIGSAALKAIAVADGTVDMYPCLYRTGEWDTCAPQIIVEEAGGSVLRYDGSGEGGMSEVAALLRASGEKDAKTAPAGTASAGGGGAGAAVGEGKRSESPASSTPDSRLVLSYNKADLSSPRCMFLGRCSAD